MLPLLRGLITSLLVLCLAAGGADAAGLLINGDRTIAGRMNYCGLTTGSANAYVCAALLPAVTALQAGQGFTVLIHAANTGASTLNINGLGVRTIKKRVGGVSTDLAAGDMGTGQFLTVVYDATNNVFQALSLSAGAGGGGSGTVTNVATSGPITGGPIVATGTLGFDSKQPGTLGDGGVTNLTCGAATSGKMQVMDNGEWQYCDGASTAMLHAGLPTQTGLKWNVTPSICVGASNSGALSVNGNNEIVCKPDVGGLPVGAQGTLQAADGLGGIAAYPGSNICPSGSSMVQLGPTGLAICAGSGGGSGAPAIAHFLTDRVETGLPNAIALGSKPSGVLVSTVVGGVADITTNGPAPTGALVGDDDVQELNNKRINPRILPLPPNLTPLLFDISSFDVGVVADLNQNTQFANPQGLAKPGQLVRFQVSSTLPRLLTWDTVWSTEAGIALPTTTSGGGIYDTWIFQYNANSGKLALIYNSQLVRPLADSGVTPGQYTCPATVDVNSQGRITAIVSGTCGGGGGGATPAGVAGDVQVSGGATVVADTGQFVHDVASHATVTGIVQGSVGGSYYQFTDTMGQIGYLMSPPRMTNDRTWQFPDEDGVLCVKGGSCGAGGGGDASTNTATSVDNEVALFSGTAGKTLKRATGTGLAKLTAGVQSTVTAPTGAVVGTTDTQMLTNKRVTKRVSTLTSSTTYTCPGDVADECEMQMTAASGTLTIAAPTGTPDNGDKLMLLFLCTNQQTLSWNALFIGSPNIGLPTTCPADTTKWTAVGVRYSTVLTKWQILAVN